MNTHLPKPSTVFAPSRHHYSALAAALALALTASLELPQQAHAAGFQLPVGNAASYGRAFGGGSLWQNDPSAAYSNPAAMAWIDRPITQGSWIGIDPDMSFHGDVTRAFGGKAAGSSPNGGRRVKTDGSGFLVLPLSDRFALGFSFTAPYALVTKYNTHAKFNQFGTMTSIKSMSLGVSGSFKVSDTFAVGAGMTAQRTRGQLNNGIDLGSLPLLGAGLAPGSLPPGYKVNNVPGNINVLVNQWSYSYFLGMEWKPTEHDSLGLSYHSRVGNRLSGHYSIYTNTAGKQILAGAPGLNAYNRLLGNPITLPELNPNGGPASAALDLPAFINLDYLHQFSERFTLGTSLQWTNWSNFRTLRLNSSGKEMVALKENYRNAFMLSIGGDYKFDEQWTLRGGFTYDQTPTKKATRDLRVPDNNRKVVAIGVGYKANRHMSFDLGYQHQFLSHARIHQTNVLALGGGTIDGYAKDSGNVYVATATYQF